jgi:hypothetical protein
LQLAQRKATKKGKSKTGKGYRKLDQAQQETLQETQRTKEAPENSKKAAEEGTAHIDEMLEYQSETDRSRVKLGRKIKHQQASKKAKLEKPNLKLAKKRSSSGKRKATITNWLNGGISSRADREENPDRDKTQNLTAESQEA